jgi:hypothetical protein
MVACHARVLGRGGAQRRPFLARAPPGGAGGQHRGGEIVNPLFPVDPERRTKQGARPIFDELAAALEGRNDVYTTPLVAHVRSTAVDLLRGTGMDYQ